MSNLQLLKLIENFLKHEMSAFPIIYNEFERLIFYYSGRLGGEDYTQELTVFLLEMLYSINISSFKADNTEGLKNYIAVAIRNKYIALAKEKQHNSILSDIALENTLNLCAFPEDTLLLSEMLTHLSEKQRLIIIYKYIYGYSDSELSLLLHISRQAINRLKNRAISALKEYYITGGE